MFGIELRREKEGGVAALTQITVQTQEASQLLARALDQSSTETGSYFLRIKKINNECNEIVRQVSERLKHSWMLSLDREDIYALVMSMSGVADGLDNFSESLSRYRPDSTPEMVHLAALIQRMIGQLHQIVPAIHRPKEIQSPLRKIERIRRESRETYRAAMSELFRTNRRPGDVLMYTDLYRHLESITDRCQGVGSLVERISIKNA